MSHPQGVQPYIQHGGPVSPPKTTTQAYLIQYQTVTSHGHEAVSDGVIKTNVAHSPGVAILTPHNWDPSSRKGRVHIPIHNPPGITKAWYLEDISVNFESVNDASVVTVTLFYDGKQVVAINSNTERVFHIAFSADEARKYEYVIPTGIALALDLSFPEAHSAIRLYSITLLYRAN